MKKKVLLVFFLVFCTVFIGLAFAGQAEAVTLTAPNGGEMVLVGSKYNITWTPGGSTMVTLSYSTDSGATWNLIYEGDDNGTFEWTVPNTTTTKARVKVKTMTFTNSGGPFPIPYYVFDEDISNADFTIWKVLGFEPIILLVPPTAPANLVATAASASQVNLAWEDKSNIETGFKIFRKTTSGSYSLIKTLGANSTSYQDTGLDANTQYIYKVQAYNSIGANDSNEDSATTLTAPPPAPNQKIIRLFIGNTQYLVNNVPSNMDVAPVSRSGRTFLPIKYIADPIGAGLAWDAVAKKATISLDGKVIELWVGSNTAKVNGNSTLIDPLDASVIPFSLPPGRIMLPLRFIAENLGCAVDWLGATKEARVTYPKP
jgi:hypothetical protein